MNQTTLIEDLRPLGFVFNDSGYQDQGYTVNITHPEYPNWKMFCWELKFCDNAFDVIKSLIQDKVDLALFSREGQKFQDLWR